MLKATDIHKSFPIGNGRLEILKGVSLEIEQGQIVALTGPSGSGKSTLLNILGTLDTPDRGEITLLEQSVAQWNDERLSRFRNENIGFVFQFHHLLPELTLWENLTLPTQLGGSKRGSVDLERLLVLTGLQDRRGHYPHQLSGGERQRVAVIRALANGPGIIFADEPTGNLDVDNGVKLMELIMDLRDRQGQTFLIATHSEELAKSADRRLFLNDGVIQDTK
ncbi:MAG: ABC transporter ATP-binding protein [Candidatus Marinimicrobia bacterium]|nr:ABC transporter ATP-binding protein [Candidatus Neomarinimicrobiota bacterium]